MMYEVITGDVVGKSNNYMIGNDAEGKPRIIKNSHIRSYEDHFAKECRYYKGKGINGRFILYAELFYTSRAFDLDNSLKTLLDCLQYVGAIKDDNLCVSIIANKHVDRRHPRLEFAIKELEPKFNLFNDEECAK